jgi:hypothetical protein
MCRQSFRAALLQSEVGPLADNKANEIRAKLQRRVEQSFVHYPVQGAGFLYILMYRREFSGSIPARPIADRLECHARQQGFEVRLRWNF